MKSTNKYNSRISKIRKVQVQVDGFGGNNIDRHKYLEGMDDNNIMCHEIKTVVNKLCMFTTSEERYGPRLEYNPGQCSFKSTTRYNNLNEDVLAENWHIGPSKAKAILLATTLILERLVCSQ